VARRRLAHDSKRNLYVIECAMACSILEPAEISRCTGLALETNASEDFTAWRHKSAVPRSAMMWVRGSKAEFCSNGSYLTSRRISTSEDGQCYLSRSQPPGGLLKAGASLSWITGNESRAVFTHFGLLMKIKIGLCLVLSGRES
jgi:hypothetical protein